MTAEFRPYIETNGGPPLSAGHFSDRAMSLTTQNDFRNQLPTGPPEPPRQGAIARTFALMKSLAGGG